LTDNVVRAEVAATPRSRCTPSLRVRPIMIAFDFKILRAVL
jgi:hypothetical protein